MDIIASIDEKGKIKSTSFHVRFGADKLTKSKKEKVRLFVNDKEVESIDCRLNSAGDVYFRVLN